MRKHNIPRPGAACLHIIMAEFPAAVLYGPSRKLWRATLSAIAISADGKLFVSAPCADPLQRDDVRVPEGITPAFYQVPSSGLTCEEHDKAMKETHTVVEQSLKLLCGFMDCQNCYIRTSFLSPFANLMLNIAGDPFLVGSAFGYQPKWMERSVLDYYASLWNARWPHDPKDPESYWGYVLTMGSSEGNIHALWSARNYLSGRYVRSHSENSSSVSAFSKAPVVFFSRNSNYSLYKVCDMVNISTFHSVGCEMYSNDNPLGGKWSPGVPCEGGDAGPGVIDIDALEKLVDFFSSKGHPIVVIFNYGTTFKGSCDDVKSAGERLVSVLKKKNMYERKFVDYDNPSDYIVRNGFWFHVDGALAAAYMPFLEMAYKKGLTDIQPASTYDFRLDFVSSIVTSGHKFIGTPWPSGVYLVQKSKLIRGWNLEYINSYDRTVALSRNGHSAVLLWSYISTKSYDAQVASVLECLRVVKYAVEKFHELQRKIGIDIWVMNTSPSLSVVFRQPNARIIQKYTLSCTTLRIDAKVRHVSQIYMMQHVTTDHIDALIKDLQASDAF